MHVRELNVEKAVSTYRGTQYIKGGRKSPVLIPKDIWRDLWKSSTWKIQNTLTSRSEHTREHRPAGVLPGEEYIF